MELRMLKKLVLSALVSSAILLSHGASANSDATSVNYQTILDKSLAADGPGMTAILSEQGKVVYSGARGLANVEHQVPLKPDTVMRIGSISKQFTAAAIMMLVEQNKLALNDDIHKYVASFPTEGHTVTIEHLLTHTSGIANYTNDLTIMYRDALIPATLDQVLARAAKHPMIFAPGEKMAYSNTGYVLLGKIIEVASGQSYKQFIEQQIFAKLGMKNSYYGGPQIIANRASGYQGEGANLANASHIDMTWPHAAGSLLSTTGDLSIWFNALATGKLISNASFAKMTSPFKLNDGSLSYYGYGLSMQSLGGYKTINHNGGINGFSTDAVYVPEKQLYIAVLANSEELDPSYVLQRIAASALNITVPDFTPITLSKTQLANYLGDYEIAANNVRSLLYENGKLYSQRNNGRKFELIPFAENSFFYPNSNNYIVVEKNAQGDMVMKFYANLSPTPQQAIKRK